MKGSLVRSLCAIMMGLLLIEYREQMVTWLTIVIGILFLISGLVSCITYLMARKHANEPQLFDINGRQISGMKPTFPIVGIGSVLLGIILVVIPNTFISWLMYIMAAMLIFGAISQYVGLFSVSRFARVGLFYWLMPTLILLIAIVAIVKPSLVATAPLLLIGWCMMVYGVVEAINAIKIQRVRRAMERSIKALETQKENETTELHDLVE